MNGDTFLTVVIASAEGMELFKLVETSVSVDSDVEGCDDSENEVSGWANETVLCASLWTKVFRIDVDGLVNEVDLALFKMATTFGLIVASSVETSSSPLMAANMSLSRCPGSAICLSSFDDCGGG